MRKFREGEHDMSMTTAEAGRIGGLIRAQATGEKSLRGIGSKGYLHRAVVEVCRRMDELDDEHKDRIAAALYGLDGDR
jgi:hypothetical protein